MSRSFALLLALALSQGLPAIVRADQPEDRQDRRETRSSDRANDRENAFSNRSDRDRERNEARGRDDEEERPARNRGRSQGDGNRDQAQATQPSGNEGRQERSNRASNARNDRREAAQTTDQESTRDRGGDSRVRSSDRNDRGNEGHNDRSSLRRDLGRDGNDRGLVDSTNRANNDRRSYQWRDRNEETRARERGWDRPVRLTESARQRGIRELPQRVVARNDYIRTTRDRSVIQRPDRDWQGRAISARAIDRGDDRVVVNHMSRISVNATVINNINLYNTRETRVGHYYWHYDNGNRYCHYRDRWGYRWFGWYVGSSYFWTRYHSGRFWWYDTSFDRWCYWHGGRWWWQDPYRVNVVYVYDNTRYVQAVSDDEMDVGLPEDADDDEFTEGKTNVRVYNSKDETRMVKVIGRDQEAFLYDTDGSESFRPVYLGNRVKEVRFSNRNIDRPLQVMLVFKDGSFELFDSRGKSMGDREF
jgi:hypothetical protein